MWYGSCDSLFSGILRDYDNFHALPNSEEGRRVITKITDICRDHYIVLVGNIFYVALSINARDKLLDKLVVMLDRKIEKLQNLEKEVSDLKECIEVIGY